MSITDDHVIAEVETPYGRYEVYDLVYEGRVARVLYSGHRQAAQSGVARDGQPDLLFDYNQRLRELVDYLQPQRILLIGGGTCTLPQALMAEHRKLRIDIIEPDSELTKIAKKYFDWHPSRRTKVIHTDGRAYLERCQEQYDLIILDAFSHAAIPTELIEPTALQLMQHCLTPKGSLAANVIAAYYGNRSRVLRQLMAGCRQHFQQLDVFPAGRGVSLWLPQNFVVVAQNQPRSLHNALRYPPLGDGPLDMINVGRDLR
ncbi:MAG TPA: fused MFS/spermidine synthase [Candidatus Saccharimonadales bacterium]|nr:fused MFS/spermidine synthase [Candidatus Saccharimonadales bacterium]